eukprot:4331198-Pleurochrysis_carterae.AAC.1
MLSVSTYACTRKVEPGGGSAYFACRGRNASVFNCSQSGCRSISLFMTSIYVIRSATTVSS